MRCLQRLREAFFHEAKKFKTRPEAGTVRPGEMRLEKISGLLRERPLVLLETGVVDLQSAVESS